MNPDGLGLALGKDIRWVGCSVGQNTRRQTLGKKAEPREEAAGSFRELREIAAALQ